MVQQRIALRFGRKGFLPLPELSKEVARLSGRQVFTLFYLQTRLQLLRGSRDVIFLGGLEPTRRIFLAPSS